MRLLLDTHVALWWFGGSPKLRANKRRMIAGAEAACVSSVSAWEVAIKASLGKLAFEGRFADAAAAAGCEQVMLTFDHAEALRSLPKHHTDPFDRMLIAQAQVEGLTLVSHDRAFKAYGIALLWV